MKHINIILFSFLVLFTIITTILFSFVFDLILGNFNLLIEDSLLTTCNNNQINNKLTYLSVEQGTNHHDQMSVFNLFIDLFNKSYSKYKYFPSHFQVFIPRVFNNNNIVLSKNASDCNLLNIKEVISYNQYLILKNNNNYLNDVLNDLYEIISDYKQDNEL
jgi:hypothetical protein